MSHSAAFASHGESSKKSTEQAREIEGALAKLQGDMDQVKECLAVPKNAQEVRQLAGRVEAAERKLMM